MIRMIDRYTGVDMWVADNRVEEFKAAGHTLAAEKPETTSEPVKEEKPKRRARK